MKNARSQLIEEYLLQVDLLFAAIILNKNEPLAQHHVNAIVEFLGYPTQDELINFIRTGKRQ